MLSLVSRWPLRNGCPPDLACALERLAQDVREHEQHTLAYSVHLQATAPTQEGPGPPIGPEQQSEVVFFEVYADAQAFHAHVTGPTFTGFVSEFLSHFYEDPLSPGQPLTHTTFLGRQSAFFREAT